MACMYPTKTFLFVKFFTVLSLLFHNTMFFEDVGAKAVQGQAYLPGSDEKEE